MLHPELLGRSLSEKIYQYYFYLGNLSFICPAEVVRLCNCLLKGTLYNALNTTEYSVAGFPLLQTLFMTF